MRLPQAALDAVRARAWRATRLLQDDVRRAKRDPVRLAIHKRALRDFTDRTWHAEKAEDWGRVTALLDAMRIA